jgi:hypothetical protein
MCLGLDDELGVVLSLGCGVQGTKQLIASMHWALHGMVGSMTKREALTTAPMLPNFSGIAGFAASLTHLPHLVAILDHLGTLLLECSTETEHTAHFAKAWCAQKLMPNGHRPLYRRLNAKLEPPVDLAEHEHEALIEMCFQARLQFYSKTMRPDLLAIAAELRAQQRV